MAESDFSDYMSGRGVDDVIRMENIANFAKWIRPLNYTSLNYHGYKFSVFFSIFPNLRYDFQFFPISGMTSVSNLHGFAKKRCVGFF